MSSTSYFTGAPLCPKCEQESSRKITQTDRNIGNFARPYYKCETQSATYNFLFLMIFAASLPKSTMQMWKTVSTDCSRTRSGRLFILAAPISMFKRHLWLQLPGACSEWSAKDNHSSRYSRVDSIGQIMSILPWPCRIANLPIGSFQFCSLYSTRL